MAVLQPYLAVPEPGTFALLGGAAAWVLVRRRWLVGPRLANA